MKPERRHVCAYCGKKRIERRMMKVPNTTLDNLPQGHFWACWFELWGGRSQNCAALYLDRRAAEFYAHGDKFKSAADKLRKYNKI